jgi:MoxR-like ATPase
MTMNLQAKFNQLAERLQDYSVGQGDILEAICLGLVAKEHVLLYGPPGCNKTASIIATAALLGANGNFFSKTLNKYTPPDELIGPVSVKGMREDRFYHCLDGYIGTAELAFIGEVFRGNGATRVALHTILNEGYVDNGGKMIRIPLHICFLDTNNLPSIESDKPFYDRLLLRVPVNYLSSSDPDPFTRMLATEEFDPRAEDPVLSIAEVKQATEEARTQVAIPEHILTELFNLRASFLEKELAFSDRRWKRSLNVVRAAAWLREADTVEPLDLFALRHVLWDYPEQRTVMSELLSHYEGLTSKVAAGSLAKEAQRIFDHAMKSGLGDAYVDAIVELADLRDRAGDNDTREDIVKKIATLEAQASK